MLWLPDVTSRDRSCCFMAYALLKVKYFKYFKVFPSYLSQFGVSVLFFSRYLLANKVER